jgi:hypothetical protein
MEGEDEFDSECDQEVWRVIAALRRQQVYIPWLLYLNRVSRAIKTTWRNLRVKHRIPAAQAHSGPNTPPGTGAGAGSAASASTFAGFSNPSLASGPGLTIAGSSYPTSAVEDAGIRAGELSGYRCWKLGADGLLCSVVYNDYVWQPGAIAEGDPFNGSGGIYAYKSVLLLHKYGSVEDQETTVTGTVDLWGEVIEHEHGYRAQYAAITSIHDSPHYDAKAIRKRYGLTKKRKKK